MNGEITKRLNDRMAQIFHRTGGPPKRMSLPREDKLKLMAEMTPRGMAYFGWRGGLHFCGVPLRIRNYERERQPKHYGPGPMLPPITLP